MLGRSSQSYAKTEEAVMAYSKFWLGALTPLVGWNQPPAAVAGTARAARLPKAYSVFALQAAEGTNPFLIQTHDESLSKITHLPGRNTFSFAP